MTNGWIMYALAALCLVLGFVALLAQKTYVDTKTNQPTEVELPLVGKLKTNYPALVFVAVGAFLAAFTWSKPRDLGEEQWTITGSLRQPAGATIKWEEGALVLLPKAFDVALASNGTFQIAGSIPKGEKFEDVITSILYTNGKVSGQINVAEEYKKFQAHQPSLVKSAGARLRDYAPVTLTVYE
ncbi:MAG TPA: hypothetical protein VMH32_13180 [Burkholderiales bacterium]|nr:hypothetical protein [Burkholderiales bacterium]